MTAAYDIVLTDIRMPDISGLIVLRDVKRQKPSLPVIIITGYASVQSAVEAMKLGAADYITKPFTPDQLSEAVATAIAQAKLMSRKSRSSSIRRKSFRSSIGPQRITTSGTAFSFAAPISCRSMI